MFKVFILLLGFSQMGLSQVDLNFGSLNLYKQVNGKSSIQFDADNKLRLNPEVFKTKIDKVFKRKGILRKKDKNNFKTVGYSYDPTSDHLIYTELKNHIENEKDTGKVETVYQSYLNNDRELEERILKLNASGEMISSLVCDGNSCRSYTRSFCNRLNAIEDSKVKACKSLKEDLAKVYGVDEYISTFKRDFKELTTRQKSFQKELNGKFFKKAVKLIKANDKQKISNQIDSQQKKYKNKDYLKDANERMNFGDLSQDIQFCKSIYGKADYNPEGYLELDKSLLEQGSTRQK